MDKIKNEIKKEEEVARKRKISCLSNSNINEDDIIKEDEDDDLCRLSLYLPYDRPITRSRRDSRPRIQQQQQPPSFPIPSPVSPELFAPSPMLQAWGVQSYINTDDKVNDDLCRLSLALAIHRPTTRSRPLSPLIQQQQDLALWFPPSSPLEASTSHNTILPLMVEASPPLVQTSGIYGYVNNEQLKAPSARRVRRNPKQVETEIIPPPYPWAKDQRATIHTLTHLESQNITTISGEVQCKRCEKTFQLHFNLREKFTEIANFIIANRGDMRDRAPAAWTNPRLATCEFCNMENSAKPVLGDDSKTLNWLFLLLGGMLGCCTLEQLKYFCKYTRNHRTGAKDRVLYLSYLALCKQLDPKGPFDHDH